MEAAEDHDCVANGCVPHGKGLIKRPFYISKYKGPASIEVEFNNGEPNKPDILSHYIKKSPQMRDQSPRQEKKFDVKDGYAKLVDPDNLIDYEGEFKDGRLCG